MGAETTIFVRVMVAHDEWIKVSAVTLKEAMEKAEELPGVVRAMEASYELGGVIT